ncbi:major capsid protein [Alcanivoracaceae bacterium MT1]
MKRATQRAPQERRLLDGSPVVRMGRNGVIGGGIAGAAALGTTTAQAAIDVTPVKEEISAQQGNVEEIAISFLIVLAVVAGFFLLRRVVR